MSCKVNWRLKLVTFVCCLSSQNVILQMRGLGCFVVCYVTILIIEHGTLYLTKKPQTGCTTRDSRVCLEDLCRCMCIRGNWNETIVPMDDNEIIIRRKLGTKVPLCMCRIGNVLNHLSYKCMYKQGVYTHILSTPFS